MAEPDIQTTQTGTCTIKTKWEAIELTRTDTGIRIAIPAFTITTLPDGTKTRQSAPCVSFMLDDLLYDEEAQQFADLSDKIAKRILRGNLKPQPV